MLDEQRRTADIFVVDDDAAVRDALAVALRSEGYGVEIFSNGETFEAISAARPADLVLLDVRMPGKSGLEILRDLKSEAYPSPVIMVTGHGDVPMAVQAIRSGAFDFIEKPFSFQTLLQQIRTALNARRTGSAPAMQPGVDMGGAFGDVLTDRERDVLRQIATGASSKEAGRVLGISPRTVEVHRARIMRKLKAKNAADLMRIIFSGTI
jgi:two-component system, LuxR family, response regulator FixJ